MIAGIPILTQGLIPTSAGVAAGAISDVPQLVAAPLGTDKIRLTLTAPADPDYLICKIFKAGAAADFAELCELASGTYDDSAVVAEQTYYYAAVALNKDRKLPKLSRVAYARCTGWSPANFAFTDDAVDPLALDLESNFGRLLYRTCQAIAELDIFRAVLPFMRPQAQWQAPSCVVAADEDPEVQATNVQTEIKYRFKIGFVVAGEDDGRLALQALSLRQKVKRLLRGTAAAKLIFTDVTGHYDTNVVVSQPGPMDVLEGGALFYNAGLTVEYTVRENRGAP